MAIVRLTDTEGRDCAGVGLERPRHLALDGVPRDDGAVLSPRIHAFGLGVPQGRSHRPTMLSGLQYRGGGQAKRSVDSEVTSDTLQ